MILITKINTKNLLQAILTSSIEYDKSTLTTWEYTTTPHAEISFVGADIKLCGYYYLHKQEVRLSVGITKNNYSAAARFIYRYKPEDNTWKLIRKKSWTYKLTNSLITEINNWSKHTLIFSSQAEKRSE